MFRPAYLIPLGILAFTYVGAQARQAYKSLDWNIQGFRLARIGWAETETVLTISVNNESDLSPTLSDLYLTLKRGTVVLADLKRNERIRLKPRDITLIEIPLRISNINLIRAAANALIERRLGGILASGQFTVSGIPYPINETIELKADDETTVISGTTAEEITAFTLEANVI